MKLRLRPKDEDDGTFWMPWSEFTAAGFDKIDICDRTTKHDLQLRVHEDLGTLGVLWGCLCGIVEYFLCCLGVRVTYCGHSSSDSTRSAKRRRAAESARSISQPRDAG